MHTYRLVLVAVAWAVGLRLSTAADLVTVDLSAQPWRLTNANQSVAVPTTLPAHVLGVLAAAGIVQSDPLYRYGELETRWVSEDTWNFTLIWSGQQHSELKACKHVLLVLHGVDTFGDVVLNGRHVLRVNNAHRSWWQPLPPDVLRDSANMMSMILQPAVQVALRAKVLNKYNIPTMAVPGGFDVYNFARKPASDFGWDWGPAFAHAGVTGPVQLLGFNRATLIGALVHQQAIKSSSSSSSTFLLHVTAHLLVPEAGDGGLLTVHLPDLKIQQQQQVSLTAVTVAGNPLQALTNMTLEIPAGKVELWQSRGLLQPGSKPVMYHVIVSFEPSPPTPSETATADSEGPYQLDIAPAAADAAASGVDRRPSSSSSSSSSSVTRRIGFRTVDLVRIPIKDAAAELMPQDPSSSSSSSSTTRGPAAAAAMKDTSLTADPGTWAQIKGLWRYVTSVTDRPVWWYPQVPPGRHWPAPMSTQPEIVRMALQLESNKTNNVNSIGDNSGVTDQENMAQDQQQEGRKCEHLPAAAAAGSGQIGQPQQQEEEEEQEEEGESFYFRLNGVPVYAKGANLIPLHVLSTAVTAHDVVLLLESAAAANMNMIRIWGGGLYQLDALYAAADELGLMVWQEAMFACSPYPRDPSFLSNVDAEITQQILRLGSHPSIILWGGNNEIEASLEWYNETKSNLALYAVDYVELFQHTIGKVVHQMLPGMPWLDSSPSNGHITLDDDDTYSSDAQRVSAAADNAAAAAAASTAAAAAAESVSVKRWGNSQNPKYGDVHYYNYKDDCQDWRPYPAARFVSEYGWQSYPSWATYRAATSKQDWTLAADMTEFRQRHPNGTIELLAQLSRRFRLPQAWQETLTRYQQQQQQHIRLERSRSPPLEMRDLWADLCQKVLTALMQLWQSVRQLFNPAARHNTAGLSSSSSSSNSRTPSTTFRSPTSRLDRDHDQIIGYTEIQHWIYLTQLQQMLCYDTALSYWRRLRSRADVLNMGILYWQLNDVWAGASWSSIDYGGVWKPLHYQLARSFADVSLSVQHDLHNDTLQVHVVSDHSKPTEAQLTIRLLSLSDTSQSCSSVGSSNGNPGVAVGDRSNQHSRSLQHSEQQQQQYISEQSNPAAAAAATATACKDTWSRFCQTISLQVPARSSIQGFSSRITLLLAAAAGCSSSSCYIHISLQAGDQTAQEATVWLAPFHQINLEDPNVQISGFELSTSPADSSSQVASQTRATTAAAARVSEIVFTVSSGAPAVYTVLELAGDYNMPGHFSDSAITIHPCEPTQIRFIPHLGTGIWQDYLARLQQQQEKSQRQGGSSRLGSSSSLEGDGLFLEILQQQSVVSSLYDHQKFGPAAS